MACAITKFTAHVQFGRSRRSKELVPRVRPKRHHTGKSPFGVARPDRPQKRGEVSAERPVRGAMNRVRLRAVVTGCGTWRRGRAVSIVLISPDPIGVSVRNAGVQAAGYS